MGGQCVLNEESIVQLCPKKEEEMTRSEGIVQYPNGNRYDGELANGFREGRETMKYADGSVYTGQWKQDEKHGFGYMSYCDSVSYEGN